MSELLEQINGPFTAAAILMNFVLIILVLSRTPARGIYIIFLLICVSVIYWNLTAFLSDLSGIRIWFYLSLIGSAMIPPLMFHFVFELVRPERKKALWLIPAYFFSGLLALSAPLSVFSPGVRGFVDGPAWDICYLILLAPFFFAGLVMLLNAMKGAGTSGERNRLLYFVLAGFIGFLTALSGHVQSLNASVPRLGHVGSVFYSLILAVGLFKHRKAYDILEKMRTRIELLNETASGIAHEIRNPLSSIKGASRMLARRLKEIGPENGEYLEIISEETGRLERLLENFQHLTRPLGLEKKPVSINDLIGRTVRFIEADGSGLRIRLDLSGDVGVVPADSASLKQVFLNLIRNAAESCGPYGEVAVKTEDCGGAVLITFADNGPGIEPEHLKRIFEPFFTTKKAGMGMGLAISRRIIDAHGGWLRAENRPSGGARFSIYLPM